MTTSLSSVFWRCRRWSAFATGGGDSEFRPFLAPGSFSLALPIDVVLGKWLSILSNCGEQRRKMEENGYLHVGENV